MKRYVITWKGILTLIALPVAIAAAAVTVSVMSARARGSSGPDLLLVSPSPSPAPDSLSPPSPSTAPSPSPTATDSPSPAPPSPSGPTPEQSATPIPVSPAPKPSPSVQPSPSPSPTDGAPSWAAATAAVMFGYDSAVPDDRTLAESDLAGILPPAEELAEWLIVCEGFSASDETVENLGLQRAQAVADVLTEELGVSPELVRAKGASPGSGNQRYRQRVDVYFVRAGHK